MLTQILERCEAIEECYEFMLAYALGDHPKPATHDHLKTGQR